MLRFLRGEGKPLDAQAEGCGVWAVSLPSGIVLPRRLPEARRTQEAPPLLSPVSNRQAAAVGLRDAGGGRVGSNLGGFRRNLRPLSASGTRAGTGFGHLRTLALPHGETVSGMVLIRLRCVFASLASSGPLRR